MVIDTEHFSMTLVNLIQKKNSNLGFRSGLTQTRLYIQRKQLEAFRSSDYEKSIAKTKALVIYKTFNKTKSCSTSRSSGMTRSFMDGFDKCETRANHRTYAHQSYLKPFP